MDQRLANAYTQVLSKHYAAVQTDTALSYTEDYYRAMSLEKTARQFWADFEKADTTFRELLDKCVLP